VLLFAALSFVATQEPVGICGLDGFNLNDLHFGQYWSFTAPDPANDCLYEIDPDNITSCVVYFAVCKSLPSSICGSENGNASYCQVVTAKDGKIYRYNVGNYSQSHKFSRLDDGFSSVRHGYKYENDRLCKNSTTASITNFECDPDAKFSTSESDITQYLKSTERIPNAECFITTTIGYSGACYQQPTLAPAHCSLTGFDTTAISEQDYFYADVPDGICYNFDEGEPCIVLFAFCHPLPLDLSDNCRNPESAICQADKLADATKSWSMGAYENYTRFYENVDFDQVGFHVLYSDGSNPGDPDCTAGIQTRVIFVCNKDAQWINRDVTFYIEVDKETCFFNIVAQYSGACYKAHSNIVGWTVNCLDEYVDPSTNCTTCRGNLKEPDCNECDDHFEGSDCTFCEPNYYPRNDCSVICIPQNNSDGHYKCDPFTGNRVCLEGYRDPSNGCVTTAEESDSSTIVGSVGFYVVIALGGLFVTVILITIIIVFSLSRQRRFKYYSGGRRGDPDTQPVVMEGFPQTTDEYPTDDVKTKD
jgi:hypothetical protein